MRPRIFTRNLGATLLLAGGLSPVAVATTGDHVAAAQQQAVTYLKEPTLIGTTIIEGPVLFIHDAAKMARGEPCTSIRLFDPEKGPLEEVLSFRCIPRVRRIAAKFTVTTRPNIELGFGCILTEYQFAGDSEGHGVPAVNPVPVH
jgi:hypothetical protein